MNSSIISTYNDLLLEQQYLHDKLEIHKHKILADIQAIEEKLNPVIKTISFLNDASDQKNGAHSVLKTGLDIVFDTLLTKSIFLKSNWLITILGSSVIRNLSASFISKKPGIWLKKIVGSKKNTD